jgi:hypothetical protein
MIFMIDHKNRKYEAFEPPSLYPRWQC